MHLSLKGSLKSSLVFTYVKTDQALDLGNLEPFTIPDLSGNANTATLYSGIYVTTNGTTDKAIGANATALGSGNYYLTGKIKPAGTTAKTTMNGSTASNLTGLTAGVWQDFQTATASAITPSSINLGWDGTAFNATVDNWSDVKLHDASDDSVVAHYKLYDSADASLDGYPALDCVGGYHGAHVGCAGGASEASILQTAGEDFNNLYTLNGSTQYFDTDKVITGEFDFTVTAIPNSNASTSFIADARDGGGDGVALTFTNLGKVRLDVNGTILDSTSTFSVGTPLIIRATYNGSELALNVNVVAEGSIAFAGVVSVTTTARLGARSFTSPLSYFDGQIGLLSVDNNMAVLAPANSPSLYHVAESETTAGQDALGNAIENPRPNDRVLNLTTGTGYATIADSASLDLTTAATWEVWPDFRSTGSERYILSKYDTGGNNRSWAIGVENPVAGSNRLNASFGDPANGTFEARLDWAITEGVACYHIIYDGALTGTARCKLYKNGVLVALSGSVANPPASLYQNNTPVLVGGVYIGGVVSSIFDEQLGDIRIYNRVLTADEILKNYNARKSAYGL
jgi:hypothetical protein